MMAANPITAPAAEASSFLRRYNQLEQEAMQAYSPYILRGFSPLTFSNLGFQTHISSENELWKFIDSQHEFRFEGGVRRYLFNRLTEEEFALFKELTAKTVAYCKAKGFSPVSGRNAISHALIALRAITALVPRGATVLDIGAGSGFVSAGLVMLGYRVVSYDVTQSFFLHQQSFFEHLFGDRYHCCLSDGDAIDLKKYDLCHIPWWNMAKTGYVLPEFDVVTMNNALNEIPRNSIKFLLQRVRRSGMSARSGYPLFVMECLGYPSYRNYEEIMLPLFETLHFNEHCLNQAYVPVVVMQEKPAAANGHRLDTFTEAGWYRYYLIYMPRILLYARRKLHAGYSIARRMHSIYKRWMPRLLRVSGRIRRRLLCRGQEEQVALLPQLHRESFEFGYVYEDLLDYFSDSLPEGFNLTQDEEFGAFSGTHDHQ